MKRILVDMTHITQDKLYNSLSIYVFRILNNISNENKKNYMLLITDELEGYIKLKYPCFKYIIFDYKNKRNIKNKLIRNVYLANIYRKTVNKSDCDILLVTSDLNLYTCVKTKLKKVVVIHDLKIIKDIYNNLIDKIKIYILKKFYFKLMKSSDAIIAISNYTKKDILHYYSKIEESKINVILNSISLADTSVRPQKFISNSRYILYVNTLQPYKNVITLVKAFCRIKNNITEKLVIVGKTTEYWEQEVLPFIKQNGISDRVIRLENISDNELKYVYEKAELFVTTSLREGFGYTPIEAAICCCPVISTKCESLPDVTKNKVLYYDNPMDDNELASLIIRIINERPDKDVLESISKEFRYLYSGKKQIEEFEKLFERL